MSESKYRNFPDRSDSPPLWMPKDTKVIQVSELVYLPKDPKQKFDLPKRSKTSETRMRSRSRSPEKAKAPRKGSIEKDVASRKCSRSRSPAKAQTERKRSRSRSPAKVRDRSRTPPRRNRSRTPPLRNRHRSRSPVRRRSRSYGPLPDHDSRSPSNDDEVKGTVVGFLPNRSAFFVKPDRGAKKFKDWYVAMKALTIEDQQDVVVNSRVIMWDIQKKTYNGKPRVHAAELID